MIAGASGADDHIHPQCQATSTTCRLAVAHADLESAMNARRLILLICGDQRKSCEESKQRSELELFCRNCPRVILREVGREGGCVSDMDKARSIMVTIWPVIVG